MNNRGLLGKSEKVAQGSQGRGSGRHVMMQHADTPTSDAPGRERGVCAAAFPCLRVTHSMAGPTTLALWHKETQGGQRKQREGGGGGGRPGARAVGPHIFSSPGASAGQAPDVHTGAGVRLEAGAWDNNVQGHISPRARGGGHRAGAAGPLHAAGTPHPAACCCLCSTNASDTTQRGGCESTGRYIPTALNRGAAGHRHAQPKAAKPTKQQGLYRKKQQTQPK
jgi:hypothetical protein